jgi:Asp-tRNA(Asn)/Glu-tRNA(Gln) amidotransferase A subunit family amidase
MGLDPDGRPTGALVSGPEASDAAVLASAARLSTLLGAD